MRKNKNVVSLLENDNGLYSIRMYNQTVGYIKLTIDGERATIESINIDIEYRGIGIGRGVVNLLKSQYKELQGFSSPLAIGFWKSVGAELEWEVTESDIEKLMDIGEYVPFYII